MSSKAALPASMLNELQSLIDRHSKGQRTETVLPGLTLHCLASPMVLPVQVLYRPMVCVIAQGRKTVVVGDESLIYDASQYLVCSVELPASGKVTAATPEHPYLAFTFALDPKALAAIMMGLPANKFLERSSRAIAVGRTGPELVEAFVRLLRLLDRPSEMEFLAPLISQEIHYRLLMGEQAPMLQQVALREGNTHSVTRVIDRIRQKYAETLNVADLARIAGMSTASLHRHFKLITSMSPLRYQKQIRLQEARRMMVSEGQDAAAAAFAVGYASPQQFSREYRRQFGTPPREDAQRVRSESGRRSD